jgi:hypothetical protein
MNIIEAHFKILSQGINHFYSKDTHSRIHPDEANHNKKNDTVKNLRNVSAMISASFQKL